jgi:ACS family pantothenate transporter-like MFS transporter
MYSTNAIMSLLLKWKGDYSIEEINYIPTGTWAVGIVATLALGWYSDITGSRWHVGILLSLTAIISGAIMLHPPSFTAQLVALFLNGFQYAGQTVFLAWANDRCYDDDPKRGIVLASMQTGSIAVYMFWSILFYNTEQVPEWRSGSIAMVCMGIALLGSVGVAVLIEGRDERMKKERGEVAEEVEVWEDGGEKEKS